MGVKVKVIVKGGLGNQLFQYSRALQLSKRFIEVEFVEDFTSHSTFRAIRLLEFLYFNAAILKFGKLNFFERIRLKLFRSLSPKFSFFSFLLSCCSDECSFTNPIISKLYGSILFDGYWQSQEYVVENEQEIFNSLVRFIQHKYTSNGRVFPQIQTLLHIRGGDYVQDESNASAFGLLSPKYYLQVLERIGSQHLTVTTDDMEWLDRFRNQISFNLVLNPNEYEDWEVLACAMSAKIFIAANSSLSWWAGFLAGASGARVIIPSPWFKRDISSTVRSYPTFELSRSDWL